MCGEKAFRFLFSGLTEGSPPHVRGKVPEYLGGGRYHGITPACAGKRSAVRNSHQWNQDHPRMCGEKITKVKNNQHAMGSPPHVRGKGSTTTAWTLSARITPSHAGKSCTFRRPRWRSRDHPRIRGEKLFVQLPDNRQRGSPPHVRGKVVHLAIVPCGEGITPACAGKRKRRAKRWAAAWDHPRMCGEKSLSFSFCISRYGITPACAGKRVRGIPRTYNERDHPRMCGEKCRKQAPGKSAGRITPACAGKRG